MTISRLPLVCPPRYGTPRNPDNPTLGTAVGVAARILGYTFQPWQQYVADVAMEISGSTGRFVYSNVGLTIPRQEGKTTLILALAVHRCRADYFKGSQNKGIQNVVYTAQTRNDAFEKFKENFWPDIEAASSLKGKPNWRGGTEHIRFPNRSRFALKSTTEKAGHGGTIDMAFIDEAFAQTDDRLQQALRPAMLTRDNRQLWVVSTAGWMDASPYLWAKVERGRQIVESGEQSSTAYFEWSAPQDADPFDRDVWRGCMPALGYTINEAAIEAEIEEFTSSTEGLNGFKRAYLNQWVPKGVRATALDAAKWAECADARSEIVGIPALAIAMTPDLETVSLAATGFRRDGKWHVEIVEHGPTGGLFGQSPGVEGRLFVRRVAEVAATHHAEVWLHPGHPAGTLLADLLKAGVPVKTLNGTEYGQACGAFFTAVNGGTLRYRPLQPQLDAAVGQAIQRRVGETWRWDGDGISALVAATQALHGASQSSSGGWMVSLP